MDLYLKELFSEYGPLALGWIVASILGWRAFSDAAENKVATKDLMVKYGDMLEAYHEAIVENTRVTEKLSMLIEERTRSRFGPNGR